ncbi:MAG: VWA domain-containing protein [bacterium]|nr:VWA domain-containing protein [bacterium]
MRIDTPAAVLFALVLTAASCQSWKVEDVQVRGREYDAAAQATRVTLTFEVSDGGFPVQTLGLENIHVIENGVIASSESVASTHAETQRMPIALLLDTSASVYRSEQREPVWTAAREFVDGLRQDGFECSLYRFARTVEQIDSIDALEVDPATLPEDQRWTSLYYAVLTVLDERPDAIVVVVSDGADSYSQNMGVAGLASVVERVEADQRRVHTIGFGEVAPELDRQGIRATTALRRLARYGTYQTTAGGSEAFLDVYEHVSQRMKTVYTYEYLSPQLEGAHEIEVEARAGRRWGRSDPIVLRAEPEPEPEDEALEETEPEM